MKHTFVIIVAGMLPACSTATSAGAADHPFLIVREADYPALPPPRGQCRRVSGDESVRRRGMDQGEHPGGCPRSAVRGAI
jgi:hypothetical protein